LITRISYTSLEVVVGRMCNRHVAQVVAEYEAARLDGDPEERREEGGEEGGEESSEETHPSAERSGLLAAVSARLAR
jgi:hypothetical protein